MFEYPPVLRTHQLQNTSLNPPDEYLTQQPKVVTFISQGHLYSNSSNDLDKVIDESGGMATMLFLVAKVRFVEYNGKIGSNSFTSSTYTTKLVNKDFKNHIKNYFYTQFESNHKLIRQRICIGCDIMEIVSQVI